MEINTIRVQADVFTSYTDDFNGYSSKSESVRTVSIVKNILFKELYEIEKNAHGELTITHKKDKGEVSDGYHTFNELYHHRTVLFAMICKLLPHLSWKSKQHDDPINNPMYDGMFICGLDTPYGQVTYHCDLPYWDLFECKELPNAPKWDGSTPTDCINRLKSFIEIPEPTGE